MSKFVPLILFIATIGLFFGFTDGQYQQMAELRAEQKSYENALVKAKELAKRRDELQQKKEQFSADDLDRLAKVLPEGADTIRMNMDLNGIASRYGMKVKRIDVDRLQVTEGGADAPTLGPSSAAYDTYELKFGVESKYFNFASFLEDLETSLRILDVREISISPSEKDTYMFSVTAHTYALKPPAKQAAPAVGAPLNMDDGAPIPTGE